MAETVKSELVYAPATPTHVVLTIAVEEAVLLREFLGKTSSGVVEALGWKDKTKIRVINDVLFEVYEALHQHV